MIDTRLPYHILSVRPRQTGHQRNCTLLFPPPLQALKHSFRPCYVQSHTSSHLLRPAQLLSAHPCHYKGRSYQPSRRCLIWKIMHHTQISRHHEMSKGALWKTSLYYKKTMLGNNRNRCAEPASYAITEDCISGLTEARKIWWAPSAQSMVDDQLARRLAWPIKQAKKAGGSP